jgi:4-amino-4-deoxy-L-arabinose transferase-like glycosyltransferase
MTQAHLAPPRELTTTGWISLLRWHGFIWILIPLLWAVTYLPQLGARDLRLEEGRRAQPAREMLQTGDWVTPRIYGEPYLNKPPLFFWVSAAIGKLQGHVDELSIRLPSVLSALLGAWLILFFAHKQLNRQTRALAALIFLSMPTMLDKGTLGEIDALLSLLTFACFVALWEFYDEERGAIRIAGWIIAGIAMALAALLKGPGGPIEFYAIFVPFAFLVGRRHNRWWKILLSPGHFLMILIAVLPSLAWIYAMIHQSNLGPETVTYQWADQLGLRRLLGTPAAFPGQKEPTPVAWEHYLYFPWQVLLQMLPPWSLLLIFPTMPRIARQLGWTTASAPNSEPAAPGAFKPGRNSHDLWLLLALSAPALIAVFWAYPAAFARHMMMVAYPVSVLVAMFITSIAPTLKPAIQRSLQGITSMMAIAIAVIGIVCIILVLKLSVYDLVITSILAAASIITTILILQISRRTALPNAPIAAAATLAVLMCVGWGDINSFFRPRKATSDFARIVHRQIDAAIPKNVPIFTTRTLLSGKGNDYFNIQFYFPTTPIGISELSDIPAQYRGKKIVLVIGWEEWPDLMKQLPMPEKFTILHAENGPPHLYAIELTLPPHHV